VLKVGDRVAVSLHGRDAEFDVRRIPARRGPAPEARACYEETPDSVERGTKWREQHRLAALAAPRPDDRPDKKSRRELIELARKQGRE
jgi:ribosome-associated heat shock protein Hsp15